MKRRLAALAAATVMSAGIAVAAAPAASAQPGFEIHPNQQACLGSMWNHILGGKYRINCVGFPWTPYLLFYY